MAAALTLLLIASLLQGALCGEFKASMLQTVEVLRGSCVTIPCSFVMDGGYESNLDNTCRAVWMYNDQTTVVFNSSNLKTSTNNGELRGVLKNKDCTTTLNNMQPANNNYFFRLECDNRLKYTFHEHISISVTDDPPRPTLTPSALKVKEGASVSLTCSAPAPCLSHPPTLTWTPDLGESVETLQENQDKTKISVVTFTASKNHHGETISCTATYKKQDGSTESAVTTSLTADISCDPCGEFKASMPQTIKVLRGSCVTIPCSFVMDGGYESNLDNTCRAVWMYNDQTTVVFNSSNLKTSTNNGELRGVLKNKDCTTTLNNMQPANNNYFFRLECDNRLKYTFHEHISISVTDDPPRPTLTPSALKVKEGTSVSLTCSAPAPCLSHPPTLTWTPDLGESVETLQENQDKTKISVVTFTASKNHHGETISCTATYKKQDGSTESAVSTSLTADISCDPCGEFKASMPQTIKVLRGSCVTIPCSFEMDDRYELLLDKTCRAVWMNYQRTVVFNSSNPQTSTINGELRGNLTRKDCTTTLNNMQPANSKNYFFRLECDNALIYTFHEHISISVTDDRPRPTLTPSALKVKEGASVSLTCSAPAPCLSHPPTLTWTPDLGESVETLQENQDKTKVQTSVVTFTASKDHHGETISCTATYNKQDGSTESAVTTSLTADISYSPKHTTVSVRPSGPVPEGSDVTLTCSSTANPAVESYTWYRADGAQETVVGTGAVLNFKASKDDSSFYCKTENIIGAGRSNLSQIDVQYPPKHTTVSVRPSGPVPEGSDVTLTCSSTANPAVKSYTWYRADGAQETVIGTGAVLNIKASKDNSPFFCKTENIIGAGRSNLSQIDVQYAPQILSSSDCIKAADQLNCSCRTVGNPSPTLRWYLYGSPVNHSDTFVISNEPLNDTGLWSTITVNGPHERDLSTLLCRSSNSLGSATQRFYVYSLEPQTSAESQDGVMLLVFIAIVVALLVLVCVLLFVNRVQKTRHERLKSQCAGDTGPVTMSHLLASRERNEVPNTAEEDIYVNNDALTCADVAHPATVSGPSRTTSPGSGPNNAEGARKSSEKANDEGKDVIYSTVNLKTKSKKKKAEDSMDVHQPGSSYLQEEMCMEGGALRGFVSNALEMGSLYDNMEPRNVQKEVESEYAQVKFKNKRAVHE